jgi:hypothetical protein
MTPTPNIPPMINNNSVMLPFFRHLFSFQQANQIAGIPQTLGQSSPLP